MKQVFLSTTTEFKEIETLEPGSWINLVNPSQSESMEIASAFNIDIADLRAPLDAEEMSRMTIEDEYTLIILTEEAIITTCLEKLPLLDIFINRRLRNFYTFMRSRFIFQILYRNAELYLSALRTLDRKSEQIESQLHKSTRNEELIELMELEKTIVYFKASLKTNERVIKKLTSATSNIKKYLEDEDLLEDTLIETQQAIEMADIYGNILHSMTDTFASIISNNQNNIMKTLALVTIVMSIPTMIFSAYGMNFKDNELPLNGEPHAFWLIIFIAFALTGSLVVYLIHKLLENGKTEEEAESLIQEILPAIHENQGKGIPARTLFGAPTVWANSFSEKERYEKEHPKLNDAPSLMILDSFLFIFGVFAAISAFMNLVAPRRTGYGLITLILGSLTGALLLYLMYYFFYQYMDGTKDRSERPSLWKSMPILVGVMFLWVIVLSFTSLLPQVLNPTIPDVFAIVLGALALVLRFYLKKRFNIKSSSTAPATRR